MNYSCKITNGDILLCLWSETSRNFCWSWIHCFLQGPCSAKSASFKMKLFFQQCILPLDYSKRIWFHVYFSLSTMLNESRIFHAISYGSKATWMLLATWLDQCLWIEYVYKNVYKQSSFMCMYVHVLCVHKYCKCIGLCITKHLSCLSLRCIFVCFYFRPEKSPKICSILWILYIYIYEYIYTHYYSTSYSFIINSSISCCQLWIHSIKNFPGVEIQR